MGRRSGAQRAKSQYYTSDLSLPARASAMPASAACLSCGRTLLTAVFALASLVVLSGDNALAQGSVAGDRLALVALYNATDGANWTNNTNWLTNEAISEWHGVVTDGEGRVKRLSLGHNELSGEIPPELVDLTSLLELYLDHNELSGEIPPELGNLTNLQGLYLWENELSGEIPAELGRLTNLQLLYLNRNKLSGEIPAALGGLTNLQKLYLDHNELSGEIPPELGNLTNLRALIVWRTKLSGEIPPELGNLTNLQSLSLVHNELSGTIPAELGNLTNLQILYLYDNQLSGEIPPELGRLANLESLYIWSNELSGEIPPELGDLTNLQGMYLHENKLSGEIPPELGRLANLRWLHLAQNELSGEIPAALGDLTNFERLNLSQNELSGEIPGELGNLANLRWLHLAQNELSGEIPGELGDLTNLQDLHLFQNKLSGTIPAALGGLTNLQGLYLNGNELRGKIPPELGDLANLSSLNLSQNRLSGPLPLTLSALPQLMRLDIRSTTLCAPTDTAFRAWVETIYFQGNYCDATTQAPGGGVFTLDFAHFANGDGIISEMVFVNVTRARQPAGPFTVASPPTRPALYFYDKEGHLIAAESVVEVTGDLEVAEDGSLTVQTEMEPLGELTISTHGRGALVSGSVKVVSEGPIGGVLRFDLPGIGVAGVGTSQPTSDAIFPARRQAGGISTAVAIHNPGEEAIVVRCQLMKDGAVLETVGITLNANGQEARFIEEVFTATDTSNFVGLVHCRAPGLFTGVAVELDAANRIFTTLPVVPVPRGGRGREATVLDFAHFANGEGITSEMVFVNVETQPSGSSSFFHPVIPPIRPALYFYDKEGHLIAVESVVDLTEDLEIQADGSLTVQTEMEPLGELTISTHGRGALVSGSVKVVSDGPIGGMLRFDLPAIGVAGVGVSHYTEDALFPARRQAGGISTAVAIHNLESSPKLVRCELLREGVLLDAVPIPLAANGQQSRFIDEMFPATDTSDFVGSVRCTVPDGGLFTGVAVELDAANRIFTTLPVVPVPERMSQE